mmetsp:Transcript_23090/g.36893  ORF Transcript_23090/g.36893 Transcript_23090/m.36893 type:complete len:221 (+) Transcript_23090:968-1630(+)
MAEGSRMTGGIGSQMDVVFSIDSNFWAESGHASLVRSFSPRAEFFLELWRGDDTREKKLLVVSESGCHVRERGDFEGLRSASMSDCTLERGDLGLCEPLVVLQNSSSVFDGFRSECLWEPSVLSLELGRNDDVCGSLKALALSGLGAALALSGVPEVPVLASLPGRRVWIPLLTLTRRSGLSPGELSSDPYVVIHHADACERIENERTSILLPCATKKRT